MAEHDDARARLRQRDGSGPATEQRRDAIADWQEHVDGKPQLRPPILPLAPAKFTGSLYIVTGTKPRLSAQLQHSLPESTGTFVQTVAPNGAGHHDGMLGYMFWAAECQGTRSVCTIPPNSCEGGVGVGATTYGDSDPDAGASTWY